MLINGQEYRINRENAIVREWDRIYCNLLKKILKEGELFENRTGIDYSLYKRTFLFLQRKGKVACFGLWMESSSDYRQADGEDRMAALFAKR